jgi:hypothetical protein
MGKKRKTRQQKIILQLKRQLGQQKPYFPNPKTVLETKLKPSQEAISLQPQIKAKKESEEKISDVSVLSYDLKLVKKDLFKTLILTTIVVSLEIVLYLNLR